MGKKRKIKLIISIIALLILIVISILFILNNPKDKEKIKYVENLIDIKLNDYVVSSSGEIKTDKKDIRHANLKFEIKNFLINEFKREMDGSMDFYNLDSDVYMTNYHDIARDYAKNMTIDSFYHLTLEDRDVMGILCEENGQYYFLFIS